MSVASNILLKEIINNISKAKRLNLTLTPEARKTWDREYVLLCRKYPVIADKSEDQMLSEILKVGSYVLVGKDVTAIDSDTLGVVIDFWLGINSVKAVRFKHDISFDEKSHSVHWRGKICSFKRAKKNYKILLKLINTPDRVFSCRDISDMLSLIDETSIGNIRVRICRIREALKASGMKEIAQAIVSDEYNEGCYMFSLQKYEEQIKLNE